MATTAHAATEPAVTTEGLLTQSNIEPPRASSSSSLWVSVPIVTSTYAAMEPVVTVEGPMTLSNLEPPKASSSSLFAQPPLTLGGTDPSDNATTSTNVIPSIPPKPDSPKLGGSSKLWAAITAVTAAPLPTNHACNELAIPNVILSDKAPPKNTNSKYVPSKTSMTPRYVM
jgi:hypothetical protein